MKPLRALLVIILSTAVSSSAGALTIKLGTLAPVGSPWEVALRRVAAAWGALSGGSIDVRIYAGGLAGDEPDMIRKMRLGSLDAAGITVTSGLQEIFKGFKALSYPLFIRDNGELAYVLGHMGPFFEQELQEREFRAVMWSYGGWTYLFSRRPVMYPQDLKSQKLWMWWGDPAEIRAYQQAGFRTVTLAITDLMPCLQSGMVDAVGTSPLLAASNQLFGILGNMSTQKLGPLWGAVIVREKTWSKVPAQLRPKLIGVAQKAADTLVSELAAADDQAVEVMKKYGLSVNEATPKSEAAWMAFVDRTFPVLIGTVYDRESYDMARTYLDEYLSSHPRPQCQVSCETKATGREKSR